MGKIPVLSDGKLKKLGQLLNAESSISQTDKLSKKSRSPVYQTSAGEEKKDSSDAVLCKLSSQTTTGTYSGVFYENEKEIDRGNVYPVELALNSILAGGWCIAHKTMLRTTGDEK